MSCSITGAGPGNSAARSYLRGVGLQSGARRLRAGGRAGNAAAIAILLAFSESEAHSDMSQAPGVEILDAYLAARIESLEQRSPLFRAAMTAAREGTIPVVIGTPPQVRHLVSAHLSLGLVAGNERVADFLVHTPEPGSPTVNLVVIRVHLDRIRAAARWRAPLGIGRGKARRWIDTTTDAILIHELWGHLIPILEAGDYTGNCPDPAPGQPALQSCVMQRENAMRQELGLEPRRQYSIQLL